jgi:hypothetical protein
MYVKVIAGLRPQSPRHYARQTSAQILQTVRSSHLIHMTAIST